MSRVHGTLNSQMLMKASGETSRDLLRWMGVLLYTRKLRLHQDRSCQAHKEIQSRSEANGRGLVELEVPAFMLL